MTWLLRGDDVLASVEVADGTAGPSAALRSRSTGLPGSPTYEGAMVLPGTRAVHTFGMRFPLDVAFCDQDLVVVDTATLRPRRVCLPRRRGRTVIEAEAGAFERWGLQVGDRLELS